jgi:hypothetical protein
MSTSPAVAQSQCHPADKDRDERGRFVRGHAPLPGAGRPFGPSLGRFGPLLGMLKQATDSEALYAAAEAEPSVATLLRRRGATAERVRRHRQRHQEGMHSARIRFTREAVAMLVDLDFLQEGRCIDADYERALYRLLNAYLELTM